MSDEFVLPDYERFGLSNLLPSVTASINGDHGVIPLPRAKKYVVLLVDGFGWQQLRSYADDAPFLAGLPGTRLTCSVPSTTATSLNSLGCGVPTGRHGVVGYTFFEPTMNTVVNALTWQGGPEPLDDFRQTPSLFQRMQTAGRPGAAVTLERFAGSALTRLAFADTRLYPRPDENDIPATVAALQDALEGHDVVYCYERLLDHTGHGNGVGSWQWLEQLAAVDDLARAVVEVTSDDVCVLITGDHGMVNIPEDHRVVVQHEPKLQGFHHIAGEGRLRQLYTDEPDELAWVYRAFLGERATVITRDEAIAAGWYGSDVTAKTASRIGDVIVAMREDWALMSTNDPGEFGLIGMHGSLTPAEMYVPLLTMGGRA